MALDDLPHSGKIEPSASERRRVSQRSGGPTPSPSRKASTAPRQQAVVSSTDPAALEACMSFSPSANPTAKAGRAETASATPLLFHSGWHWQLGGGSRAAKRLTTCLRIPLSAEVVARLQPGYGRGVERSELRHLSPLARSAIAAFN